MERLLTLGLGLILLFASAGELFADETTDALVREVIAQAKTDTQRATMLYDAFPVAKDNTKLQIALLEKAVQYGIASTSTKGFDVAGRSLVLLAEKAPDRKSDWKAKKVELYRARYRLSRDKEEKGELGQKLVAALLESAAFYENQSKWQEAASAYREAGSIATSLKLGSATAIQQKQRRVAYLARVQQNVARYRKSLDKNPESLPVRTALLKALVVDLDDPKEASKYLSEHVDEVWRVHVPLSAQAVAELKSEECRALGDWYYKGLFKKAGPFARANVLVRAKMYYELFLERHTGSDAQAFQARIFLGQVENELKKLDAIPKSRQAHKALVLNLGRGVGMKLVRIPAGTFVMGSPGNEPGREPDGREGPQHKVTISKPFYVGVTEVTQEQYAAIMGKNPSTFKSAKNPVEQVSWNDAVGFCKRLSAKIRRPVRLPTEAEWEYACRGHTKTRFYFGEEDKQLGDYAWHKGNSGDKTHPVGQKKPNEAGLHDMYGNVWEWCLDWYDKGYYAKAKPVDPRGPKSGSVRVRRGGSWHHAPRYCRSAGRYDHHPNRRFYHLGFRVVLYGVRRVD